jgi:hypothetical protein
MFQTVPMKRLLAAIIVLAACKPDPDSKPAVGSASPTAARPARDRNEPRPSLPSDPGAATAPSGSGTATERPSLDDIAKERDARREEWRKQREAALDTNKDGQVSDEERAAGQHKRAEDFRARLDTNNDGKLTPDELKGMRRRMRFDDPAAIDKDGNGDISADELDAALQEQRRQIRGPGWGGADR